MSAMMGADDGRTPVGKYGKGTNPKARKRKRSKRKGMHVKGPGGKGAKGGIRYRST